MASQTKFQSMKCRFSVYTSPDSVITTVYPKKYVHGFCFAVLCCGYTLIFPYPSGLLHWHCGNLTIAPVPAKQPWWIWINTSCEFIMNDCITTTKQSTTKPCAYFLGYTVCLPTSWGCINIRVRISKYIHINPCHVIMSQSPNFNDCFADLS